jgi:hypothetical protein
MPYSGMLRCVALVRTDASEERNASIIRVTRIGEIGSTINGSTDQRINGSTDQRINGSTEQRINGSTDQR